MNFSVGNSKTSAHRHAAFQIELDLHDRESICGRAPVNPDLVVRRPIKPPRPEQRSHLSANLRTGCDRMQPAACRDIEQRPAELIVAKGRQVDIRA
ncbi:hypothetical protein ABIF26_003868 [Bradyrhizobium elkanii]|uniref:hypothetical protein n=1 Tax=Bradyrhizobium elkanii TaxID=29448 RepID=UPI0035179C18